MNSEQNLESHLINQLDQNETFLNFFWLKARSLFVFKMMTKYHKQKSVLDIGAGAGMLFKHLKDISPSTRYYFQEPLQSLREEMIKVSGPESCVMEGGTYLQDSIVMLDVLEHIEDDQKFLNDLNTHMTSESIFIITCPAFKQLWSEWDQLLGHHRRYTKKDLEYKLKTAGFEILESRYLFHFFVIPALIRRKQKAQGSEFPKIPNALNLILFLWALFELNFLSFLPFGTSITAVVRRKNA